MNKSAQHGSATTFFDNYNIHEVLTDAAGEGYIIDLHGRYHDVQVKHVDVQVKHVRGTIYLYTAINVGQVFTIRTLDGKAVERNSGLLKITYLADTKGDSDPGNDVYSAFQIVKIAGVQPLQTETEAEFCAVIQEAMDG